MHLCKCTGTMFDCSQLLLEYCSLSGWPTQLSAVCFDSRICWWSNPTNRTSASVLILLFKVCALSIKFASDFLVKSSSLEVSEQPFFDVSMSKFNLGPMPLWHGAASPLYMPPPPPLLINLLPPLFPFFHRQEAHGWRQDGKNVIFLAGGPTKEKPKWLGAKKGGGSLEESVTKIVTF